MISPKLSRRELMAGALMSPALVALAHEASSAGPRSADRSLVVYFTRTGNTKVIAGTLQRDLGAELFEIRASEPYPEDYEQTVERARLERDAGTEPALAVQVGDMATHDTIFLGFPIWGETTPPPIRSFLRAHDLAGKTIYPFITHGGYGIGNAMAVLSTHAPKAHIEQPFVMEADQERRTLNEVRGWIGSLVAT